MDTVRIRMRLVCFVKWNNLNDCEIGSHSSHLCRSQGLAHVVQRDHFSSQGLLPFGNRLSWSPVSHYLAPHCLTRTFPFEPCASHLNIAYYFSTFTEFPSLTSGKLGKQLCLCMMCTRTFPCECVHLHTCEINEQPHMYVLTLAMWDGVLPAAVCRASWPVPVPSPLGLSEPRSSCLCDSLCHWAITSAPRAEIFFISFLALRI